MGTAIRPAAGAKDTRLEIFQSCFKRSCLGLPVMAAEDLEPAAIQPGAPTPAAVTLGAADALPGPVAAVEESKQSVPDTTAVTELAEALSGLELGEPTGEDIIKQLRQFAGVSDLMVRLAKERATLITGLKDEGDRTFRPMEEQRESLRRALAGASGHLKQAIRLCGKHRNVTELAALKVRFQKQLESLDPMWATLKKANQGAAQIQLRK
jgi:hypothetical protein